MVVWSGRVGKRRSTREISESEEERKKGMEEGMRERKDEGADEAERSRRRKTGWKVRKRVGVGVIC